MYCIDHKTMYLSKRRSMFISIFTYSGVCQRQRHRTRTETYPYTAYSYRSENYKVKCGLFGWGRCRRTRQMWAWNL